jgi:hypothetical protein
VIDGDVENGSLMAASQRRHVNASPRAEIIAELIGQAARRPGPARPG